MLGLGRGRTAVSQKHTLIPFIHLKAEDSYAQPLIRKCRCIKNVNWIALSGHALGLLAVKLVRENRSSF